MLYYVACAVMFALAYLANGGTITIGYHRGFAHKSLTLHPFARFVVVKGGIWLTGLDPKAWIVMHRMHHAHSDTAQDPHAPGPRGYVGMVVQQYYGVSNTIRGLRNKDPAYTRFARDLDFDVHPITLMYMWWLPYALNGVAAIVLGMTVGWLFGIAYYVGIASHPFLGAVVNYFGHKFGKRNFETSDASTNSMFAVALTLGEGYQNNHHRYPSSAKFAYRRSEIDLGYALCVVFDALGLITINRDRLIPRP